MSLTLADSGTTITGISIKDAEKHYNAKFVMDTSVKSKSGEWVGPVALFYGPTEHPVSKSRYFALRVANSRNEPGMQVVYIMNGQSAVDHVYEGLVYQGEVYHSRHRHDFRSVGSGDFIDGGLDYTRLVGLHLPVVKFTIVDGEPVFQQANQPTDMEARFPESKEKYTGKHSMDQLFDQYDPNNPEDFWK